MFRDKICPLFVIGNPEKTRAARLPFGKEEGGMCRGRRKEECVGQGTRCVNFLVESGEVWFTCRELAVMGEVMVIGHHSAEVDKVSSPTPITGTEKGDVG